MSADEYDEFERDPALGPLSRLSILIGTIPWFRHVGDPLSPELEEAGLDYAAALGFPDAAPAILPEWRDAAAAAESIDLNSPAWEAEELLRMSLNAAAEAAIDPQSLDFALTHIATVAAEAAGAGAEDIAAFFGIDDEEFLRTAIGAGVQICHQAALVLAAGETGEHPFARKFRLFERGRWPIGIIGGSLNIF